MGRTRSRAWTLPELMAAVVIVAILAVIAIPAYRSLVSTSYKAEPARVLNAIRTAQEAYRGAHLRYAQPSAGLGSTAVGGCANCYPTSTPGKKTTGWGAACTVCGTPAGMPDWPELDVKIDGPVMFGYSAIAGLPGANPGTVSMRLQSGTQSVGWAGRPGWETMDWYAMTAVGDVTGEGTPCMVLGTSFTTELMFEAPCQ